MQLPPFHELARQQHTRRVGRPARLGGSSSDEGSGCDQRDRERRGDSGSIHDPVYSADAGHAYQVGGRGPVPAYACGMVTTLCPAAVGVRVYLWNMLPGRIDRSRLLRAELNDDAQWTA